MAEVGGLTFRLSETILGAIHYADLINAHYSAGSAELHFRMINGARKLRALELYINRAIGVPLHEMLSDIQAGLVPSQTAHSFLDQLRSEDASAELLNQLQKELMATTLTPASISDLYIANKSGR